MNSIRANQIGLIAHYSKQGDWAFAQAFDLAKSKNVQFNIFCFSETTYNIPFDLKSKDELKNSAMKEKLISEERKLREYFDKYLEDYEDVGFKLCTRHRHNFELKSCMIKNEFQVLVIPYINYEMKMDNLPIKKFASNFVAPVILVGPEHETQFHLNYPACLLSEIGSLPERFSDPALVEKLPIGDRGTFHTKY